MWYHILDPLTEVAIGPKGRNIIWNDVLEDSFKELKCMVSADNLLNFPDWKTNFTLKKDASDKQLGAVIIHINKTIAFLSRRLIKTQRK